MLSNMYSKRHLLKFVIEDRRKGISLFDLSKKYRLSKSTVSLWCRNVKISTRAKNIIMEKWLENTNKGRVKGIIKNKQKRIDSIEKEYINAKNMMDTLVIRDLLVIGIGLYWAEGSKKEDGSGFSFINSDHLMIKLMYDWLIKIMSIKKKQLIINLVINITHKDRERKILNFWSNLLDFPLGDFGNTTFIKTSHYRIYNNHSDYFGMLRIKVKSSSWLRRRILGMIKIFKENKPA